MAASALSHEKASFVATWFNACAPADCTCPEICRRRVGMFQQPKLVVFALCELNSHVARKQAKVEEEAGNAIIGWRLCQVRSFVEWKAERAKVVLH